jgi:glycosyltransferase involved in cell wall biosynthesis
MSNLQVSVIIPTKNRSQLLTQAVESIWKQTCLPQEIIIIDDASTAVSYIEVIENLRSKSPIPLIYQRLDKSSGACITRNTGVKIARGDILMFLDDDDTWMPTKIENQLHIFKDHPEVGLVYAGRLIVDESGKLLFTITPKIQGQIYEEMLQRNHIGVTSTVAIRKQVFWEAGGFDSNTFPRDDYDLWIRIAKLSVISFDPMPTVKWTIHSQVGKQSSSQPELYEQAVTEILKKYKQDITALPLIKYRKALASHYTLIADKYALVGSSRKYYYVLRSLLQYPSIAALVRFLPYSLFITLRRMAKM